MLGEFLSMTDERSDIHEILLSGMSKVVPPNPSTQTFWCEVRLRSPNGNSSKSLHQAAGEEGNAAHDFHEARLLVAL